MAGLADVLAQRGRWNPGIAGDGDSNGGGWVAPWWEPDLSNVTGQYVPGRQTLPYTTGQGSWAPDASSWATGAGSDGMGSGLSSPSGATGEYVMKDGQIVYMLPADAAKYQNTANNSWNTKFDELFGNAIAATASAVIGGGIAGGFGVGPLAAGAQGGAGVAAGAGLAEASEAALIGASPGYGPGAAAAFGAANPLGADLLGQQLPNLLETFAEGTGTLPGQIPGAEQIGLESVLPPNPTSPMGEPGAGPQQLPTPEGTSPMGNPNVGPQLPGTPGVPGVTQAAKTAFDRIIDGTGTAADWASMAGQGLPALLQAWQSSQSSDAASARAAEFAAYGAPSRARYEGSYAPGFIPPEVGMAADDSWKRGLAALSATGGNPFGNVAGLAALDKSVVAGTYLPQLNAYRNQNAATSGIGAYNAAALTSAASADNSSGDWMKALAYGASNILNPQQGLEQLLRQYQSGRPTGVLG